MDEAEARKLVAFTVIVYNLAGAFVIYCHLSNIVLKSVRELFMTLGTMPVTFLSLIYPGKYPDFWYPVVLIQIAMLCISLYLMDATVRYFQR